MSRPCQICGRPTTSDPRVCSACRAERAAHRAAKGRARREALDRRHDAKAHRPTPRWRDSA